MNEHLFKLKKDGKAVGYCKWTDDWGFTYSLTSDFDRPFHHFAVAQTKGITVHPFVTKDKNGKDVFLDDEVVSNKDDPILEVKGVVKYRPRFADYIIEGTQRYGIKNTDIELIEDKDND